MEHRRRSDLAIWAGALTAVLWQVSAEISSRLANAGQVPPAWPPPGSAFPLVTLLALVPDGGWWLVGLIVSFVLIGLLTGLGVRLVMRPGFDGLRSFLAVWMVVVLAAGVTTLLTMPIVAFYGGDGLPVNAIYRGAMWGVATGWLNAALVALGSRRRRR
jgi:hypothetical protein